MDLSNPLGASANSNNIGLPGQFPMGGEGTTEDGSTFSQVLDGLIDRGTTNPLGQGMPNIPGLASGGDDSGNSLMQFQMMRLRVQQFMQQPEEGAQAPVDAHPQIVSNMYQSIELNFVQIVGSEKLKHKKDLDKYPTEHVDKMSNELFGLAKIMMGQLAVMGQHPQLADPHHQEGHKMNIKAIMVRLTQFTLLGENETAAANNSKLGEELEQLDPMIGGGLFADIMAHLDQLVNTLAGDAEESTVAEEEVSETIVDDASVASADDAIIAGPAV